MWLFAAILYVVGVLAAGGNRWIGGPVLLSILLGGDIDPAELEGREISTGDHCFGCTAGAGSSCGGAIVKNPCPSP